MKKLNINLDGSVEKLWNSVAAKPEFEYTSQKGILATMLRSYAESHMTPSEKAKATAVASEADAKATLRLAHIKKWATLDAESRWVNRDNFIKYADPAIVAQCHGDAFQALEFEALQYE